MIEVHIELGPVCDFGPQATTLSNYFTNTDSVDQKMHIYDEYNIQLAEWIDVECSQRLIYLWSLIEDDLTGLGISVNWAENIETDFILTHGSYTNEYIDPYDVDLELVANLPYHFIGVVKLYEDVPDHVINFIRLGTDYKVVERNDDE